MNAVQPGLCGLCQRVRIVETRTGSRFYLCGLSASDPRFPRYPRLPVVACAGFRPVQGDQAATSFANPEK